MAGTIRAQQPASMRSILVPCCGRVSSDLVIRAIGKGADAAAAVA
ncbi:MAG: hydrogenase iron-sulfur subunit [Candidatus Lokiarchaeota archaeon]|nr:hydrogenase iron-sulfur subunit [Candidatus Lokiarchaeota archaeon]